MTMLPVRPEPEERPKIKRAMRAARILKWGGRSVVGLALLLGLMVGGTSRWYFAVAVFLIIFGPFFVFTYWGARCPLCGQLWGGTADETESIVCSRCRLDIGLGLREP